MNAPLRWTIALASVAVLGFASGLYLGSHRSSPSQSLSLPAIAPSSSARTESYTVTAAPPVQLPGTLREIMELPGDFAQSTALYVLAASSDREGIERLLREADSIDRGSERRAAISILYQRYAELDPAEAVEHMMRRNGGFDTNWLYAVFYSWARTDLDGALAFAAKLDDRARQPAGTAIVRSRDDLPAKEREALGSRMKLHVAVRDPSNVDMRTPKSAEREWRSALAITDREAREAELYSVVQAWAQEDAHAAIRAIESLRNRRERQQFLQHAVNSWAQKDAREAVEWLFGRPPSHERSELLADALSSLVRKEPSAAIALTERLLPAERQHVMHMVVLNWADADPHAAAAWAEKHAAGQMHGHVLNMVASSYAARDPEQALRWAATLPDEHSQAIMSQVIQQIAHDDPEQASSLIGRLDDGPARKEAIANIAQAWAQQNPRGALSWVGKLSNSEATPDLYGAIYGQWSAYEADTAVSQLNFILDSDTRDAAIVGIVQHAHLEPGAYDQLLQRLESADAKRRAATVVYYRLKEIDPASAERYRDQAEIADKPSATAIIVR